MDDSALAEVYAVGFWLVGFVAYVTIVIYGFATYGLLGGTLLMVLGPVLAGVIGMLWPLWALLLALLLFLVVMQ
jgi:hypothetical protein